MSDQLYGLTARDVQNIAALRDRVTRLGLINETPEFGGITTAFVRVSSVTTTSGRYPGRLVTFDPSAGTFMDGATIWVVDPNGNSLGLKYGEAFFVGVVSGVAVFLASANLWDDGAC